MEAERQGLPRAVWLLLAHKSGYRLPLRELQGFATNLRHLAMPASRCRTTARFKALHLLVERTGLTLFGAREWEVSKRG